MQQVKPALIRDTKSDHHRWPIWLLILALLGGFACTFMASSLALYRRPDNLAPAHMLALSQADYGLDPVGTRFARLDPEIVIAVATDEAQLQITPLPPGQTPTAIAALILSPTRPLLEVTPSATLPSPTSQATAVTELEATPTPVVAATMPSPASTTPSTEAEATATMTPAPSATATVAPSQTATARPSLTPTHTTTPTSVPPATSTVAPPDPAPTLTLPPPFTPTPTGTAVWTWTPTPAVTSMATPTVTPIATATQTPTMSPTATPAFTPTPAPTATPTITRTPSPTATATFSATATPTATPTITRTPSPTATETLTSTPTPTATATATPTNTAVPPNPLHPILECVVPIRDHYLAFFGYLNESELSINRPIGPSNRFTPSPDYRGQPIFFVPGRVEFAFVVLFDGAPITWHLDGRTATASRYSTPCFLSASGVSHGWTAID